MLKPECIDKESFISLMQAEGWKVNWSDRRSHITFENEEGKKVRDSNILKTFGWDVTKEALEKDLSLKVPAVTEKSTIEEILKAYMIKRKAGRADGGELPRNYALIHRRRSRKLMKWNCRLWVDYTEIVADNSINIYVD